MDDVRLLKATIDEDIVKLRRIGATHFFFINLTLFFFLLGIGYVIFSDPLELFEVL